VYRPNGPVAKSLSPLGHYYSGICVTK
jgi:hypothetical protein